MEKLDNNTLFILDGSFTSKPGNGLTSILYNDPQFLSDIDREEIRISFERINFVREYERKEKLVIIDEVRRELEEKLRILNVQIEWRKKHESSSFSDSKKFRIDADGEDTSDTETLCIYSDCLYKLIKARGYNVEYLINSGRYNSFLRDARILSRDIDRKSEIKKEWMNNAIFLGLRLKTDQKIAALALTASSQMPVKILTEDKGIMKLVDRLKAGIRGNLYDISRFEYDEGQILRNMEEVI